MNSGLGFTRFNIGSVFIFQAASTVITAASTNIGLARKAACIPPAVQVKPDCACTRLLTKLLKSALLIEFGASPRITSVRTASL